MLHNFNIQPIERFAGQDVIMSYPKEIACFSYDDHHQFHLDDSSLKYYYPPDIGADLSKGFDSFDKLHNTVDGHIDSLLKALLDLEQKTGRKIEANFITWRGMMTKLMGAIYNDFDGFEMNATLFDGTIFIEENFEYQIQCQKKQFQQQCYPGKPSQEMMSFWGYKFETLCLLPKTWHETSREYIENRENEVVNNKAQYCSIVKTEIQNSTMILGGEVDGVWDAKPNDHDTPINWIELKTSVELASHQDFRRFERKLMKFWIQSFLLGVPKIIIGFRTHDGFLKRIEEFETSSIPSMIIRRGNTWDGNMCQSFLATLLSFFQTTIVGDGLWRVRRKERSPLIEVFQIEGTEKSDILSEEFIQWRMKLHSTNNSLQL